MSNNERRLAVIGTAGRDSRFEMSNGLWQAMLGDLRDRITPSDVLISGGAAWADHLAVHAYLNGWCAGLNLFLPAPFQDACFLGPYKSAGSTANFYHRRFSSIVGEDSLAQIATAIEVGAVVEAEPEAPGVRAMFARNRKVAAAAQVVLAYTFGADGVPLPGGSLDTWLQVRGERIHVGLKELRVCPRRPNFDPPCRSNIDPGMDADRWLVSYG